MLMIFMAGCKKVEIVENARLQKVYVSIVQVNKDGTRTYSKIAVVNLSKQ